MVLIGLGVVIAAGVAYIALRPAPSATASTPLAGSGAGGGAPAAGQGALAGGALGSALGALLGGVIEGEINRGAETEAA